MNKVILIGNVGSDPEVRQVGESQVVNFSLATSKSYKKKNGEKQTDTEWHNIVIWGNLSKVIELYVKKGDKLALEGEIKTEVYEKDGEKKYATKIICNQMEMLGSKSENKQAESKPTSNNEVTDLPADDLPF